jgi:S-methylmethionine-dependent homocysteine/selenocysteine methylase
MSNSAADLNGRSSNSGGAKFFLNQSADSNVNYSEYGRRFRKKKAKPLNTADGWMIDWFHLPASSRIKAACRLPTTINLPLYLHCTVHDPISYGLTSSLA